MSKKLHESMYAVPAPATARTIIEGWGWHAAQERWPELTRRQLKTIYAASKKRQPAESVPGLSGQPARRLGGIDPAEMFQPPEDWLSSGECYRECGLGAHGASL